MVFCFEKLDLKWFKLVLFLVWKVPLPTNSQGPLFSFSRSILCSWASDPTKLPFCPWMDHMCCFACLVPFFCGYQPRPANQIYLAITVFQWVFSLTFEECMEKKRDFYLCPGPHAVKIIELECQKPSFLTAWTKSSRMKPERKAE